MRTAFTSKAFIKMIVGNFSACSSMKNGVCYKSRPSHLLEGLLVEKTSYKGAFYFHLFVSPLWLARQAPILNYSLRFAVKRVEGNSLDETVVTISKTIQTDEILSRYVEGEERTPQDFLKGAFSRFDPISSPHIFELFDFAVTNVLCDKLNVGLVSLKRFQSLRKSVDDIKALYAGMLITSLEDRDDHHLSIIEDMEKIGRNNLGLEAKGPS